MTDEIPEVPIKWIIREVQKYLSEEQYDELMTDLAKVKLRYDLHSRLRTEKAYLRDFRRRQHTYSEGTERWRHWAVRVESKMLQIERLKKEIEELDEGNKSTISSS